MNGNRGNQK